MKGPTMSRSPTRPLPAQYADDFDPDQITDRSPALPDRTILYAPEGWGKTSWAAQADAPVFLLSRGEDGLFTLKDKGQLPPSVRHFPKPAAAWDDVKRALAALAVKSAGCKTLVLDTLNGLERLCHEHVCQAHFGGDWIQFDAWARGPKATIPEWQEFLIRLDALRANGMAVIALAHAAVEKVPNPAGTDWDRYQPAMDRKYLWPLTHKWADLILFGNVEVYVEKADKKATKGKATGGSHRILYCQPNAAFAAKNRHGLPEEIDCGSSPQEAWANFQAALHPAASDD